MFMKRKLLSVKWDDAMETLDGDENRLNNLLSHGVIVRFGDSIELGDAYLRFFEEVLLVNETIDIALVKSYIEKLTTSISFYLATESTKRKAQFLREIKHTFRSIENATHRNVIDMKRNVDDTYKQEPNFKIKELRLKGFDEKTRQIVELIKQTENTISTESIFFANAMDIELNQTIADVKESLRESAHGLISIQAQIIDYLNRIEYQSRIVKKVRQLKYLKDQFMIEQNTDVRSVFSHENAVWMETQPKYITRVSLDYLRNDDAALEILERLRLKLTHKSNAPTSIAGRIDPCYLEQQEETRMTFDHQEVINGFLAQGNDLFHYIWHYDFNRDVEEEQRLVLFLQIASQYCDSLMFTDNYKMTNNVEYPIIYPK